MRKRNGFSSWVLVTALLMVMAVTLPAEAQKPKPRPSTYVEAYGGLFLPLGDWLEAGWKPYENIEIAAGYHFLPFLALEGGFHHFRTKFEQTSPYYVGEHLMANGIVLTPRLIYPLKRFELYLGSGAGYYWIENGVDYNTGYSADYYVNYDSIWGFHALAGASFDIIRWLYIGLEGKYVILFNFLDKSNITGFGLTLGIGFRFL
jgi:hypothetical protein